MIKVMKTIKIILLLFLALTCSACPSNKDEVGHRYITIVNTSDTKIRVQMAIPINQADTSWHCRKPALSIEINSNRQFECMNSNREKNWEDNFKTIPYIQFLIFDAEVYDEYRDYCVPCEEIDYTIPVLHRYQLRLEDLQRMNWTVVFPPME